MQKILSFILSVLILFSSSVSGLLKGDLMPEDFIEEVKMEFVEKFSEGVGMSERVLSIFFDENTDYSAIKDFVKEIGATIVGYSSFFNEVKVFIREKIADIEKFCEELETDERVVLAVPQIVVNVKSCSEGSDPGEEVTKDPYLPNDPWGEDVEWNEDEPGGYNWHLEAIQALSAWEHLDRMSTVDLGIVDSGFDVDHEDLQGKIVFPNKYLEWTNSLSDHGTHVAGIISANADNGIGVCGVCPNAKLHCVDWEPDYSSLSQMWVDIERIYSGLYYTVKDGAKVVNFSLGSDMFGVIKGYPKFVIDIVGKFSSAYLSILIKNGYDFIVCQAAGNGNDGGHAINAENNLTFCSINENNCISERFGVGKSEVLDRVIVVGSAAFSGFEGYYQPSYSNVGERVDICAPGDDVYSTLTSKGWKYGFMSGTSMATPVVTAVCGLVWSIDSSFTGPMVKRIVCSPETAGPLVRATTNQRYDFVDYRDYNLVNARLCVEKAIEISDNK